MVGVRQLGETVYLKMSDERIVAFDPKTRKVLPLHPEQDELLTIILETMGFVSVPKGKEE